MGFDKIVHHLANLCLAISFLSIRAYLSTA